MLILLNDSKCAVSSFVKSTLTNYNFHNSSFSLNHGKQIENANHNSIIVKQYQFVYFNIFGHENYYLENDYFFVYHVITVIGLNVIYNV